MEQEILELISEPHFIGANTIPADLDIIRKEHIIPVFSKDNYPLISQAQFIDTITGVIRDYPGLEPEQVQLRISHPVMGRIPEAKHKRAQELLPHEKTVYYERMMFLFKIRNITSMIDDKELSLVIGGVKSYSWDNLSKDHRALQTFKLFAGFQVRVCSNLCVSTDGVLLDIKTNSIDVLEHHCISMLNNYSPEKHLQWLSDLEQYWITEKQFAHFIGKSKMLPYLESSEDKDYIMLEAQLNAIARGYVLNPYFSSINGKINLWNLYNLMTDANKSSYIDTFLNRSINLQKIMEQLKAEIREEKEPLLLP